MAYVKVKGIEDLLTLKWKMYVKFVENIESLIIPLKLINELKFSEWKILVYNINKDRDHEYLRNILGPYGEILWCKIYKKWKPINPTVPKSKGRGMCIFQTKE